MSHYDRPIDDSDWQTSTIDPLDFCDQCHELLTRCECPWCVWCGKVITGNRKFYPYCTVECSIRAEEF